MSNLAARIIIYSMIAVPIIYDILACVFRWPTISSTFRAIDVQTNTLFRWMLLLAWAAVWMHCFLPKPWGGWE